MARKPRVLCVDDRVENLLIRKIMLETYGCEVTAVHDADACLNSLQHGASDLVLIDYHLAGSGNGEDLARTIRKQQPQLPLIMLTGDPQVPSSAKESVDILLIKGDSSPGDLLDAIQKLLPEATIKTRHSTDRSEITPKAS